MEFSLERMLSTLPYVGKGMLGIFLVIGVIILSVVALNAFGTRFSGKK